jgi:uncharacterized protein (TIGR03435 family)
MIRAVTLAVVATCSAVVGAGQSQRSAEFEVASIKRNLSDPLTPAPGVPPNPATGQLTLTAITARFIITRAFPELTTPLVVEGVPSWAESDRYDVTVRFTLGATPGELAQMWRKLFADRMRLSAHVETRPRPAYKLVVARADRELGPQLKPATLQCRSPEANPPAAVPAEVSAALLATIRGRRPASPQEQALLQSQCNTFFTGWNALYAGSLDLSALAQALRSFGRLDRPVIDSTGLEGQYAINLSATPIAVSAASSPESDASPSIFVALQEQLGLKLEATTLPGTVLVIDHIERPTEN